MSAIITKIVSIIMALVTFLSAGIAKIDTNRYLTILLHAFTYYFDEKTNDSVDSFLEKTDGVVKGVCHPNEKFDQIKDANIEWVRFDLSHMPLDAKGNRTPGYLSYIERAKSYADRGFKVMCITPYPEEYIENGFDPRTPEGKEKVKADAKFLAQDLQGIVSAFQITNEMGIEHFTLPLTIEEAAEYIGIQLEAMKDYKGDIVTGFNIAGMAMGPLLENTKPYYQYCDYIGIDIYLGCFENIFKYLICYDLLMQSVFDMTHLPVMINEFGYIGYGEVKTREQKNKILQSYGYADEDAARADFENFLNQLPPKFKNHLINLEYSSMDELADKLFNTELANHLYREIQGGYELAQYKHNPEDQARFFTDCIARLSKIDFCVGAFVYCYSDSDACYICGQEDCPVETGWGLVDLNGNPKPAYYAVKDAYAKWN